MNLLQSSPPSLLDRTYQLAQYPYNALRHPANTLLSTPLLSFLAIPAFTSWSTSINLLFFYLTWSALILSHPPLKIELLGTLFVRLFCYVLPSLAFLAFDSAVPSLAVAIKEQGDVALPLGDHQGGAGRKGRWWKVALVSAGNVLLSVFLQAAIELLFTSVLHIRSALRITTSLPMPWGIAVDVARGLLLREVLTYLLHRYILHNPNTPLKSASKYHAAWQHAVPAPYSLTAHYDHPLPYLLHVFLPDYLPALLFRFHLLSYHLYLALVSLEETFAYSGYNVLPSGLVLGGMARRQERHLMGGGQGNYGCWGLVDFAAGTSMGEDVIEDVRGEAEKKDAAGKARAKGKEVKRKAKK